MHLGKLICLSHFMDINALLLLPLSFSFLSLVWKSKPEKLSLFLTSWVLSHNVCVCVCVCVTCCTNGVSIVIRLTMVQVYVWIISFILFLLLIFIFIYLFGCDGLSCSVQLSCSMCDLVPQSGLNLGPLHWEYGSQSLDYQGSPSFILPNNIAVVASIIIFTLLIDNVGSKLILGTQAFSKFFKICM